MKGFASLVFLLLPLSCFCESIPLTRGTTLAGREMALPRDLTSPNTVLILGFSERSAAQTKTWAKKIWSELCAGNSGSDCYQMPVLASVPRLLRGVVLRSIRKDVPEALQNRFLPIFEKEQDWKRVAKFLQPDDAYVLLVKQDGEVRWMTHGEFTAGLYGELKALVRQ